jgi:hypothetical protein
VRLEKSQLIIGTDLWATEMPFKGLEISTFSKMSGRADIKMTFLSSEANSKNLSYRFHVMLPTSATVSETSTG